MRLAPSSRLFLLAVLAVLIIAVPVFAAGDAGKEKDSLGFTGLKRYDLGIYTLVVFSLLVFVIMKFAWPNIRQGLEKRELNIRGALDEARKDREDAKVSLTEAKRQLHEAAQKAKEILDEARRDADALKVSEREVGTKEAAAERERARREIEAARDAALKDIYEQAVTLATNLSSKTLARQITADDHRRLLAESLDELKQLSKSNA